MSCEWPHSHPSPLGWHSSLMKHNRKSQLPPRPTLEPPPPRQGPGRQPSRPPPQLEWASPRMVGLLQGLTHKALGSKGVAPARRTGCCYFLRDPGWVSTVQPWLLEEVGGLPWGTGPAHCPQLPVTPLHSHPRGLLREGQGRTEIAQQPQGRETGLAPSFQGRRWIKMV